MAQLALFPGEEHAFRLNLNPEQISRLQARLRRYAESQYMISESRPDVYIAENPCIVTIALKTADVENDDDLVPGKVVVLRVYVVAFMLAFDFYPKAGFVISHICGNGRCIQTDHMEIADRAQNRGRIICHGIIDDFIRIAKLNPRMYSEAERTGTIYCHSCSHTPTCFKNI